METSDAGTMNLTWDATGYIDVFEITYNYTIKRCLKIGKRLEVNISNGSVRSHTLRDLNEDSRYTITVRAINTVGSTMTTTSAYTLTSGERQFSIGTLLPCAYL